MRSARKESSTGFYHVICRGINQENVFASNNDRDMIIYLLKKNLKKYPVEIYAYCIMSNHFHLIVKSEIEILSIFMARVLAVYAKYYNYKKHRVGYVFQNRFQSECIENEIYFWNCIRYIHKNPLQAKATKDILKYEYSSMKEYCMNTKVLLHQRAIGLFESEFLNLSQFISFHKITNQILVEDVKEDLAEQRKHLFMDAIEQLALKEGVELEIVFNFVKYRDMCLDEGCKILKVSKKEARELFTILRNEKGTGFFQFGTGFFQKKHVPNTEWSHFRHIL